MHYFGGMRGLFMEKKKTRKEQAKMTRARILEVCKQLLKERTYEEINIADICEIARISVGAFYHHFPSKDSIVIEIYRDIDSIFAEDVFPEVEKYPAAEAIVSYLDKMGEYAELYGIDFITNLYKAQINHGNEFYMSDHRGLPQQLLKLIKRAVKENVLKAEVDEECLMNDLLMITRGGVYHWCVCGGKVEVRENIRRLTGGYLKMYLN